MHNQFEDANRSLGVTLLSASGELLADALSGGDGYIATIAKYSINSAGTYTILASNLDRASNLSYELSLARALDGIHIADGCTLPDAITAANTDEPAGLCPGGDGADMIRLSDHVTLEYPPPDITSEITLEGGGFTIDGRNRYRIFYIAESGYLTLKNVVLQSGEAAPLLGMTGNNSGGAIHNRGFLNASDCAFVDNHAGNNGGAIFNIGDMTVANCEFVANHADWGGAILHKGAFAHISGSEFYHNEAKGGGAIFNDRGMMLTVDGSLFKRNDVADFAKMNWHSAKKIALTSGKYLLKTGAKKFAGATAAGVLGAPVVVIGGAAYAISEIGTLWYERDAGEHGRGGAITSKQNATLRVTGSRFEENGGHRGGAVANRGNLEIANTGFFRNTAEYGGAINDLDRRASSYAVISNSEFEQNSAGVGGAISNSSGGVQKLRVLGSVFKGNGAKYGGALFTNAGGINVNGGSFSGNTAEFTGGAGYIDCPHRGEDNTAIDAPNARFSGNTPNDIFDRLHETLKTNGLPLTDVEKLTDNCAAATSNLQY